MLQNEDVLVHIFCIYFFPWVIVSILDLFVYSVFRYAFHIGRYGTRSITTNNVLFVRNMALFGQSVCYLEYLGNNGHFVRRTQVFNFLEVNDATKEKHYYSDSKRLYFYKIQNISIPIKPNLSYNIFNTSKDNSMETKKCTTLDEAREQIDKVDEEIVALIAKRNDYIKQIAHFKTSIEEVKAEDRISDVISRVREQAISLDLSPNLINDLYVRMIDAMVESEISEFENAKGF